MEKPKTNLSEKREDTELDKIAEEAKSAFRLAMRIADLVNIENKCYYFDQTLAVPTPQLLGLQATWLSSTPEIVNRPPLGDEDFMRIGDSIKIQHFDLMFTINAIGGVPTHKVRVVVYWDETNSTNTANEVLETFAFGTSLTTSIPKNWEEKASTKILHDKVYTQDTEWVGSAFYNKQSSGHRISMPINRHTQFQEGTQTIVTGALKFFMVTDQPPISTPPPNSINWQSRVIYTDD